MTLVDGRNRHLVQQQQCNNNFTIFLFDLPFDSWTIADYEATCRQMGYLGGRYVQWMDRVNSSSSRPLLWENPHCSADPQSQLLSDCQWHSRRVGPGVCGEFIFHLKFR